MANLSTSQKELLDLFFETKTQAKVLRRQTLEDGSFKFYDTIRDTRPIDFAINDEEFAIKIHEIKPNAPLTPIYVNLRNLPEELLDKVAKVLSEVKLDQTPDLCTGIPKTAVTMAQKYSKESNIPFIDLFDKVGSDTNRKILAKPDSAKGEGKSIIIIDDVVSQARSKIEAIAAAEEAGYKVLGVLILVDREQGGAKQLEEKGYKVNSAFRISEIMEYYLQTGKVTQKQYNDVIAYLQSS